jgi:hypothetical protein
MALARISLAGSYGVMLVLLVLHPDHTVDQSWSRHAEIHLRQAINFAGGLCLMGLVMSYWGLRSPEGWVRWALCLNAVCLFGGYAAPPLLLSHEPFSPFDLWGMSGLAAANLFGLIRICGRQPSGVPAVAHGGTAAYPILPPGRPFDQPPTG